MHFDGIDCRCSNVVICTRYGFAIISDDEGQCLSDCTQSGCSYTQRWQVDKVIVIFVLATKLVTGLCCVKVDRTGEDIEAVDKDGWQYDFDFAWIKFPSEPGKGKKYIFSSLVRRRRWIRTRTQREGTSNSFQSNESGFVLPDMTQIVNRC